MIRLLIFQAKVFSVPAFVGEWCDVTSQCKDDNSRCTGSQCVCESSFFSNETICIASKCRRRIHPAVKYSSCFSIHIVGSRSTTSVLYVYCCALLFRIVTGLLLQKILTDFKKIYIVYIRNAIFNFLCIASVPICIKYLV